MLLGKLSQPLITFCVQSTSLTLTLNVSPTHSELFCWFIFLAPLIYLSFLCCLPFFHSLDAAKMIRTFIFKTFSFFCFLRVSGIPTILGGQPL